LQDGGANEEKLQDDGAHGEECHGKNCNNGTN
jgi:hypothetical protein